MLAYQYLQMLPQIAQGDANKLWIIPSEMGKALEGLGSIVGGLTNGGSARRTARPPMPRAQAAPASPREARRASSGAIASAS